MVENVFGIPTNRWRVLLSTINQRPHVVENMVLACSAMHNFLREEYSAVYDGPETNSTLQQAVLFGSTNPTQQAKITREVLTEGLIY